MSHRPRLPPPCNGFQKKSPSALGAMSMEYANDYANYISTYSSINNDLSPHDRGNQDHFSRTLIDPDESRCLENCQVDTTRYRRGSKKRRRAANVDSRTASRFGLWPRFKEIGFQGDFKAVFSLLCGYGADVNKVGSHDLRHKLRHNFFFSLGTKMF